MKRKLLSRPKPASDRLRRPAPITMDITQSMVGRRVTRDPQRPAAHFRKVALSIARATDREIRSDYMSWRAPLEVTRCAQAIYSGGADAKTVKQTLRFAVGMELLKFQQWNYTMDSDEHAEAIELLAAAYIVDPKLALRLYKAHRRCHWSDAETSASRNMYQAFGVVLGIESDVIRFGVATRDLLTKKDKIQGAAAALIAAFQTLAVRSVAKATVVSGVASSRLISAYLTLWTKRKESSSEVYLGNWSLIATAMCKRFAVELPDEDVWRQTILVC
jgi:hypothetical protein